MKPIRTKPARGATKCIFIFVLTCILILTGCIYPRPSRTAPGSAEIPIFIPPELNPATATPDAVAQSAANQQNQDCGNNLKFVSDITIPDGTQANIGEAMEKKWEVENSGTCNWISGYTLRLVAGGSLGANPEQALYPALAGSKVTIQINFLAPTAPGNYKSAWQAYGLDDKPFGEVIYIQIEVK
jgi:hypothetical protein